jgi:hypothetical protein
MERNLAQHDYLLPAIKDGLTKAQITLLVQHSVKRVMQKGNIFQVIEAIAVMAEFIKTIKGDDKLLDFIREELAKYQGKYTTKSGAKIEACETSIEYDYSNEIEWVKLDNAVNELLGKRKELEEKLKKIPAGKIIVDIETGETLTGPSKTSKSSYKITLLKQ